MRVMIALENRFLKSGNGNIYSQTLFDYDVWKFYLQSFDEIIILARVSEISEKELDKPQSNGPGVTFWELPTYIGQWQFLRKYFKVRKRIKEAVGKSDAYIMFVPGMIASLLGPELRKKNIPYTVEMKGDPLDATSKGSMKSIWRPLIRKIATNNTTKLCRHASVISYVTQKGLQKRYPSDGVEVSFSDVRLRDDAFIDDVSFKDKLNKITAKATSKGPWRLCHVGMMGHLYKAPDVIIDAVAGCIKKGYDIEMVFIGDGKLRGDLEQRARNHGVADRVKFLGKLDAGIKVIRELDNSDIFLLPSRQEGLPRAMVEAMARGLPCIGSSVGGIPELIDEENIVEPGDLTSLEQAIISLLDSSERMILAARRNLETAQEYRYDLLNKKRLEFYQKIIESSNSHR